MSHRVALRLLPIALLVGVAGCGGSGPAPETSAPAVADDALVVDWNEEDYRLDRVLMVRAYLYHDTQPRDPWGEYLDAVTWDDRADSLGRAAFLALPAPEQAARRQRADEATLRAVRAVRTPALALWHDAQEGYQPCLAYDCPPPAGAGEAVTRALKHLTLAVGLDPTDPYPWYHLGYFADLVGDSRRAAAARETFLALAAELPGDERETVRPLRVRAILDEAWARREAGRYDDCIEWLQLHLATLRPNPGWELSPVAEARLIWGLCLAERGQWAEAREFAHGLPILPVPVRNWVVWQTPATAAGPELASSGVDWYSGFTGSEVKILRFNFDKQVWSKRENDFLRRWVLVLGELRSGHADEARRLLGGEPDWELEYLPGVAHRWWQDLGQIYEQLGETTLARRCYARGAAYRPYFLYYPLIGARGMPEVHTAVDTGTPYNLTYRTFFTGGSLYSYAANCALACEAEAPGTERDLLFATAFDKLDACRRRGLHPSAVLALRGRLEFLQADYAAAESDLELAHRELTDQGREDADVQFMLGLVRLNRNDFTGAIPWLERFTELKPDAAAGWRALGLAHAFAGHDTAALAALDRAVALEPAAAAALYNRGLLHYRAGQREAALADLERARELWPDNPQIATMVDVAREGPLRELDMTPSPVRLEMDAAERERVARVREGSKQSVGAGVAGDLAVLAPEERASVLDRLRRNYADDPSPANRTELAWTALMTGRPELTQEVLAPLYPDRIAASELRLLLQADRARGEASRAADLAAGGRSARERWPDAEVWALAAAICLDHGHTQLAVQALDEALRLDPANVALQTQRDRLRQGP